jgi:hypothetical protein
MAENPKCHKVAIGTAGGYPSVQKQPIDRVSNVNTLRLILAIAPAGG